MTISTSSKEILLLNAFFTSGVKAKMETSGAGEPCVLRGPSTHMAHKNPFYFLYLSNQSSINFFFPHLLTSHRTTNEPHFSAAVHPKKIIFKMIYIRVFAEGGQAKGKHFCKSATIGRNIIEIGSEGAK